MVISCEKMHMISILVRYGFRWHSDKPYRTRLRLVRYGLSECHLNPYRMERFLGHNSRSILPHAHCSSIMHYVWSIMQCNTQLCLIDVLFCIMIVQLCLLTRPLCILYLQLFNMPIIFCNASFLMAL